LIRIYYQDSTFEGEVRDIPSPVGIVCIVVPDCRGSAYETGRMVLHSAEYYICKKDDWFRLDTIADLVDHVLHSMPDKVLKGRWVPDIEFEAIVKHARKDPGLPRKSMDRPIREGAFA